MTKTKATIRMEISLRFRYRFRPNSSFFILHFSFKAPFPPQYNYP